MKRKSSHRGRQSRSSGGQSLADSTERDKNNSEPIPDELSATDVEPKLGSSSNEAGTSQTSSLSGKLDGVGEGRTSRKRCRKESENNSDEIDNEGEYLSDNSGEIGWNTKKRKVQPKRGSRRIIESDEDSDQNNPRSKENKSGCDRSKRQSKKINYFDEENEKSGSDDNFDSPKSKEPQVITKRRPGRPKKNPSEPKKSIEKESISEDDKTNETLDADAPESRNTPVTTKRRPGRPKKTVEKESNSEEELRNTPATTKRRSGRPGRPKKSIVKESDFEEDEINESLDSENDNMTDLDDSFDTRKPRRTSATTKRRPGRPPGRPKKSIKKESDFEEDETDESLDSENEISDLDDSYNTPKPRNGPATTKRRPGRPGRPKKSIEKENDSEEEPRNTPATTKRRPGRPGRPGRPKKSIKLELASEDEDNGDNPDEEEVSDSMDSSSNNVIVTCQICHKEMKSKDFQRKHKKLHHGICWTEHEDPIDYFNPYLVLEILGEKRKNLQLQLGRKNQLSLSFKCFFCNEVKKSELGYYSHLLVCNRSDEDVIKANKQCDKCEKVIFLPHYHAHQLKHVKPEEPTDGIEELKPLEIEPTSSSDRKRSAARRAVSRISNISKDLRQGEDVLEPERKRKKKDDDEYEMGDVGDDDDEEGTCKSSDEENEDIVELFDEDEADTDLFNLSGDEYKDSLLSPTLLTARQPLHQTFSIVRDLKYSFNAQNSFLSSKPLYTEFQVPKFEFLKENVAGNYLPKTKTSIGIHCSEKNSFQIDLFSATNKEDRGILFTGGPVWAMAWCPHTLSSIRSDEYLAIASQPDIDRAHEKNIPQFYRSVIQIWEVPQVSCLEASDLPETPRMVLAIAHEEGAVWSLQWCPSGGFIQNERLGLLAAACSSGKILLYAIPWLTHSTGKDRIVSLEPVRVLQIDETNSTPCYNLVWDHCSPHEFLYAGYGDGFVAIFTLMGSREKLVLPIHIFQAHLTEVSMISLSSCKDAPLLLTSGNDKLTKVWDLTNLTSPIQLLGTQLKKKAVSGGFVPYLPLFITSSDYLNYNDQSGMSQLAVRDCALFRDTHMITRFLLQSCAHFTTTFSNYASSLVTGSEDGNAYMFHYGSGLFLRGKQTTQSIFESVVMELEPAAPSDEDEGVPVSSYEHAFRKYKIDFFSKDHPLKKKMKKCLSKEECDIVNVTSSCWNNNANNFRLIALGQKCGLVHIMCSPHPQRDLNQFHTFLKTLDCKVD